MAPSCSSFARGIALVDRLFDFALEVGLRIRERRIHRLRRLDARVARAFPVQAEELVNGDICSPFTNVLFVSGFDLGGVAHLHRAYELTRLERAR